MKLLDYNNMQAFLIQYFGSNIQQDARMVGPEREYCSDYFDILRFYGNSAIDPANISIKYISDSFSFDDPLIASFAERIGTLLQTEGRIYDGPPVMKLVDTEFVTPPYCMTVQPAEYAKKAGSCFALDFVDDVWIEFGGTLREYYKQKYSGTSITKNPLAICLGVSGLLLINKPTGERGLLIVYRSGNLASLEHTYGPSAAGSVDWSTNANNLHDLCLRSMSAEVIEELHLPTDSFDIKPLAYTREIFRGEQPHLFCLIETSLMWEEIEAHLISFEGKSEFENFLFMPLDDNDRLSDDNIAQLNHETKMNYYLLREYMQERQT